MIAHHSSIGAAKRLLIVAAGVAALATSAGSTAETIKTVNGTPIDSAVLDVYMENRVNKPLEQVTPEEREALVAELSDIYLLSTQESAKELEEDPKVAAQLELQKRGVLAQAAAEQFLAQHQPTEEEIQAEYEDQVKVAPTEQFKARHILVETQAAAQEVVKQLEAGADFQELAKEKSTGPAGASGGDLGWFSPNQMVKPFADAVAKLENGAYTKEPVQTEFGWHVILREDSRTMEPPTLASVRDVVTQSVQQKKFQAHLEQLRQNATASD
jgi:peptidyl-prolyl cis-trans isomerase C